MTNCW